MMVCCFIFGSVYSTLPLEAKAVSTGGAVLPLGELDWLKWLWYKDNMLGFVDGLCHMT